MGLTTTEVFVVIQLSLVTAENLDEKFSQKNAQTKTGSFGISLKSVHRKLKTNETNNGQKSGKRTLGIILELTHIKAIVIIHQTVQYLLVGLSDLVEESWGN